jgi:hypothetical protein
MKFNAYAECHDIIVMPNALAPFYVCGCTLTIFRVTRSAISGFVVRHRQLPVRIPLLLRESRAGAIAGNPY